MNQTPQDKYAKRMAAMIVELADLAASHKDKVGATCGAAAQAIRDILLRETTLRDHVAELEKDATLLNFLEGLLKNTPAAVGFNDDPDAIPYKAKHEDGQATLGFWIFVPESCKPEACHTGDTLRDALETAMLKMQP
jgi:hypothetical protein